MAFFVLKVLPDSKDKTLGRIFRDPDAVINAEDGIEDAFVNKAQTYSTVDSQVFAVPKITEVAPGISPGTPIYKDITLQDKPVFIHQGVAVFGIDHNSGRPAINDITHSPNIEVVVHRKRSEGCVQIARNAQAHTVGPVASFPHPLVVHKVVKSNPEGR